MGRVKLRRGLVVGALDAANDALLSEVFVDTGVLARLRDPADAAFLVIGRTGSGKTALLSELERRETHCRRLDPEELSMQYLQNSQILRFLTSLKINLEIFYKYLWRHVCVLELSRLRYEGLEPPGPISRFFRTKAAQAQEAATTYAGKHQDFWITSERCVQSVVDQVTNKLEEDFEGKFAVKAGGLQAGLSATKQEQHATNRTISADETRRVQEIVSSVLVTELNAALESLAAGGFQNKQQHYFLLIDDLDKNWMPDDSLYLELLRCLLQSVRDINTRLSTVKIVVALRENIYHRIFTDMNRGPQREKWNDYTVKVRWTRNELTQMLTERVAALFRQHYTKEGATLADVLPSPRKARKPEPMSYILDRTLDRPRDVIRFVNMAIEYATKEGPAVITWASLRKIDRMYSIDRLESLIDEWRDSYPFLGALCEVPRLLGVHFRARDMTDEVLAAVYAHKSAQASSWLEGLVGSEWRLEMLKILVITGVLGVKEGPEAPVSYSWEDPTARLDESTIEGALFEVHTVFHRALGIGDAAD
ncbi:MAG: hypothetical protein KC766_35500 [Myxococcales bacterium]|nr:hypothetical protein [Myxococcales bacterium]